MAADLAIGSGSPVSYAIFFARQSSHSRSDSLPLLERKARLREVLAAAKRIRYAEHVETEEERLFKVAEELGLEGIVAKRADSVYRGGRTKAWLKIKTAAGQETVQDRAEWNKGR